VANYLLFLGGVGDWFKSVPWLLWVIGILVLVLFVFAATSLIPWRSLVDALKSPDTTARKVWVWVVASLLSFALANAICCVARIIAPLQAPNAAMVFSVFWAIAVGILILILIFSLLRWLTRDMPFCQELPGECWDGSLECISARKELLSNTAVCKDWYRRSRFVFGIHLKGSNRLAKANSETAISCLLWVVGPVSGGEHSRGLQHPCVREQRGQNQRP
jgi:hypothetical protein